MKRWTFGVIVSGFFAGITFVLTTVLAGIIHIYRHGAGPLHTWQEAHSRHAAISLGIAAGVITMAIWARTTRAE